MEKMLKGQIGKNLAHTPRAMGSHQKALRKPEIKLCCQVLLKPSTAKRFFLCEGANYTQY